MNDRPETARRGVIVLLAAATMAPLGSQGANIAAANCGPAAFAVVHTNKGQPLANLFELSASPAGAPEEKKKLHRAEGGGWFYASCLTVRENRPLLVFQETCAGSACAGDNYGIVDPVTLKILLAPAKKSVGNGQAAARILGVKAPYLPDDKSAFCCEDTVSSGNSKQ